MVGISLLTLVPRTSGGSETYARELVRGLARVGRLEYHVYAPTLAPGVIDGLRGHVVESYEASDSTAGRLRAMAAATTFPGRVRREVIGTAPDVLHFPLTITIPRGAGVPYVTSVLDVQHEVYPRFFPEPSWRTGSFVYRADGRRQQARDRRSASMRARRCRAARRRRPSACARSTSDVDHDALRRPATETGAVSPLPRAAVAPQEPRAAFRSVRAGPARAAGAAPRAHRRGPSKRPAADGVEARGRVSRDELVRLYQAARRSSSRRCTRGSGCPRSRRWRAAARSRARTSTSLPEVAGDAARLFDPRRSGRMAPRSTTSSRTPEPWILGAGSSAPGRSRGTRAPAPTTTSTRRPGRLSCTRHELCRA